jgi:putative oxidoreductase
MAEVSQNGTVAMTAAAPDKPAPKSQFSNVGGWAVQILVAVILAQTLFFKFTYASETQVIFANRGGRPAATALGVIELICAILLLTPRGSALGALVSLAVTSGAIFTHLTSLGIQIVDPSTGQGDHGLLFGLAITVAAGSLIVLWIRWRQLPWIGAWFASV